MGSTDVALLGVLIFLALGLSWFAIRVNMMLWRLGAALSWFAIGVLIWTAIGVLIWTNTLGTDITDPWTYAIALALFVMIIAVFQLQIKTDIAHERSVRGKVQGRDSSESQSWTSWGSKPNNKSKKSSTKERQESYRDRLASTRRR